MATFFTMGEGEDDAYVQGAEWLQSVISNQKGPEAEKAFAEEFQKVHEDLQESRTYDAGPLFDLFLDQGELLFSALTETGSRAEEQSREVESFFSLVLSMLLMMEDTEHLDKATTRLCKLFSADDKHQADLRLRLLMTLYNTYNNPTFEFRYRVFKHVLDYAAKAQLFDQVTPYLEYLDDWLSDWEPYMSPEDKQQLYCDLAKYMRNNGKQVEAFLYLKKFHQLFQGASKDVLAKKETLASTIELVKDAIQLPSVLQFDDILAFDTVKSLAKSKQADLLELCKVFLKGSVADMQKFYDGHKKLFEEHQLDFQDAMAKIKLLTLATLAQGRSEIDLSEIAKVIDEKEDSVERWVVRAISEGVVDGRIDQLALKVLVKSSFQRTFEKQEWTFLDTKLTHWIDNLENVIKFIGDQKALREQSVQGGA